MKISSKSENSSIVPSPFLYRYTRFSGSDALRFNALAAEEVSNCLRTSFGPLGRDKIIRGKESLVVTKDGFTILENLGEFHPVVSLIKNAVKSLKEAVGDGTTSTALLIGELLGKADELRRNGVPLAKIMLGYSMAYKEALRILEDLSVGFNIKEKDVVQRIAYTVLYGSGLTDEEINAGRLPDLVTNSIHLAMDEISEGCQVDPENIKVVGLKEGLQGDSKLVKGIVIKPLKELHPNITRRVENAKIALINKSIGVELLSSSAKIQVTAPATMAKIRKEEAESVSSTISRIRESNANVIFCSRRIDDIPAFYFAKHGILAVRNVSFTDMKRMQRATGGKIVTMIEDLEEKHLGYAKLVEEQQFGKVKRLVVEGCLNPKAVTILLLGATKRATVATRKAIRAISAAARNMKTVPGGGAVEIELARRLRDYALKIGGKEQLAISAFADSFEVVPRLLAENSGEDVLDSLTDLYGLHSLGKKCAGFDVRRRKVVEALMDVVEPLEVKKHVLSLAYEVSLMMMDTDEVIINEEAIKP